MKGGGRGREWGCGLGVVVRRRIEGCGCGRGGGLVGPRLSLGACKLELARRAAARRAAAWLAAHEVCAQIPLLP